MTIHPLWFMVEVKVEVQDFKNERQIDQLKESSSPKKQKKMKSIFHKHLFSQKNVD